MLTSPRERVFCVFTYRKFTVSVHVKNGLGHVKNQRRALDVAVHKRPTWHVKGNKRQPVVLACNPNLEGCTKQLGLHPAIVAFSDTPPFWFSFSPFSRIPRLWWPASCAIYLEETHETNLHMIVRDMCFGYHCLVRSSAAEVNATRLLCTE